MSRSDHTLRSVEWYGSWAAYCHHENRDARRRGRVKRDRSERRAEQREQNDQEVEP